MDRSEPRRGGLRRTLIKLGISLGSLVVALLVAEGITRLFFEAPPQLESHNGPQYVRPIEPPIERELIPGVTTSWLYPGCAYNEEKTIVARINEHGVRGRSFSAKKPEGVTRILCVGDSMTFGTGVQEDETWPVALQEVLEAEGKTVEVWNCGVPGFNTIQEVAFLEERLLPFDPDLVILCYYVNDAQIGEPVRVKHSGLDKLLMRFAKNNPKGLAKQVRSVSRLAEIVARRLFVRISMKQYNANNRLPYTAGTEAWLAVQRELKRARELCETRGIGFCLVLYPIPQREGDYLATHQAYQHVRTFCEAERIACLDLEPVLLPLPVEEMWVGPLNMHPNGELNRVSAGAIGQFLLDGGFLPDSH